MKNTSLEKCKKALELGYKYDPETGLITGLRNFVITGKHEDGYIRITNVSGLLGHVFAWYYTYGELSKVIDHINGIKDDNRLCNLRNGSQMENCWTRRYSKENKKIKGYSWHKKSQKWCAKIQVNYQEIHLGYFDVEADARQARLEAELKYHQIKT